MSLLTLCFARRRTPAVSNGHLLRECKQPPPSARSRPCRRGNVSGNESLHDASQYMLASAARQLLDAANLGDDADTTAAIYGQLAGALYGVDGIPEHWRERVLMRDEILGMADALFEMSEPRPRGDVYWVLPEGLLAGAYPGSSTRDAEKSRLTELLDQGITTFIDLTEEGEGRRWSHTANC